MQDINFGTNKSTGLHMTNSSAPESARNSTTDPDATHFPPWNFLGGVFQGPRKLNLQDIKVPGTILNPVYTIVLVSWMFLNGDSTVS